MSFHKVKNIFQAYFLWLRNFYSNRYSFQLSDARLYLNEITWEMKNIHIANKKNGYLQLSIDGKYFFWPKNFQIHELPWIYNEIFIPFEKNPNSFIHPNIDYSKLEWVIDAGAHEGFFTRYALDLGVKEVIAVEPIVELGATLNLTFKDECVQIEEAVLGIDISERDIYVDPDHLCETTVSSPIEISRKVSQITVDYLVEKYKLTGPGLIKADIEGSEMNCLIGAEKTLKNNSPYVAFAVYHDFENAKLCAEIIQSSNPDYILEYRGMNANRKPPRPHMLFGFPK